MFLEPFRGTAPCLTCGGTGRRGNLSGKKRCKTCDGSGKRSIKLSPTDGTTLDDFTQVVIPPTFYSKVVRTSLGSSLDATDQKALALVEEQDVFVREYLCVPPPLEPDNGQD